MSHTQYGSLGIQIPEGWEDNSIITLLGPEPEAIAAMTAKPLKGERPNLVLRREILSTEISVSMEDFATAQEQMMESLVEDLTLEAKGKLTIGQGEHAIEAVTREFTFSTPPNIVRQLQVYFSVGNIFFIATGTGANDMAFPELRQQFETIIANLHIHR